MFALLLALVSVAATAASAQFAPVTFNNGPDVSPACAKIECAPVECVAPFQWTNAKDAGTCCPVCFSAEVVEEPCHGYRGKMLGGLLEKRVLFLGRWARVVVCGPAAPLFSA